MGGFQLGPNGKPLLGPNGRVMFSGKTTPPPVAVTSILPETVSILSDALPGSLITPLTFVGFTFAGTPPTLNLVNSAGNRVALAGNWTNGYSLVVGIGSLSASGNYTLSLQFTGDSKVYNIGLTVTASSGAVTIFEVPIENADNAASLVNQELSFGQYFRKGDVPTGTVTRVLIDGSVIPCQVSERIFWSDGSLKHALVRALIPSIAGNASKSAVWQRIPGSWNDTALHTVPTCITNNVTLELSMTSWRSRSTANVLGTEKGPLVLNSNDMLASTNAPWIEKVMSGPICNEWRISAMARSGAGGAEHAHQGGWLYVRAWAGTANKPKRIQFIYRTIYGWSTEVAADEQGLQVDLDLKVNGTVVRGSAMGTVNWSAVKTWKGGFLHSADTDGMMDWVDVDTNAFFHPPRLIYRHNMTYGELSKWIPPIDRNNPSIPLPQAATACYPGKRGPLRPGQDDVADAPMITWTVAGPVANLFGAYQSGTPAQVINHRTTVFAAGWGMGAMTAVGIHRATRKIVSYLPPEKTSNAAALGATIFIDNMAVNAQPRPANLSPTNRVLNTEISGLDSAHFPQMAYWPAVLDGDQHFLDLVYQEVVLPGAFSQDGEGFHMLADRSKIRVGGINWLGQPRAVGHMARSFGSAIAIGRPSDPHYTMAVDYLKHWVEMTREVLLEEDAWRGNIPDGRRFQDLKLLRADPIYKTWMHTFGLHNLSYSYGVTEDPLIKERADWWAYHPTVICGGYNNQSDVTLRADPMTGVSYNGVAMSGFDAGGGINRRFWKYFEWRAFHSPLTLKADGQTVDFTDAGGGMIDGLVVTVTALKSTSEPYYEVNSAIFPTGITRATPYYTVQSGTGGINRQTKLSLTLGGPPVTFNTGGVDMALSCTRCPVPGWHTLRPAADTPSAGIDFPNQVKTALDMYQWYVSPDDYQVNIARWNIADLKARSGNPTEFDPRGKTTVPVRPIWLWDGPLGSHVDIPSDDNVTLITPASPTKATAARFPYPTIVGKSYTWKFVSDIAIERRIGTAKDGATLLVAASVTGAASYTFTATTTTTWVYLARVTEGSAHITGISLVQNN